MNQIRKIKSTFLTFFGFYLLTAISNALLAAPRIATNPSGKSIDQVGDGAITWLMDDIRPWAIVSTIIIGIVGAVIPWRGRWIFGGSMLVVTVVLMALPSIVARAYQWI